jgi:hypothetical protein
VSSMKQWYYGSWLFDPVNRLKAGVVHGRWQRTGRPVPPPHSVKQYIVLEYLRRNSLRILIETGTYRGKMIYAMRSHVDRIVSVELDKKLAERAQALFQGDSRVGILQGDSGVLMPGIVAGLQGPALFWLDGHWSGGESAKGQLNTPIIRELEAIFAGSKHDHVILIDDALCFTGKDDYPTIDALRTLVMKKRPGWSFTVSDNIVRIHA